MGVGVATRSANLSARNWECTPDKWWWLFYLGQERCPTFCVRVCEEKTHADWTLVGSSFTCIHTHTHTRTHIQCGHKCKARRSKGSGRNWTSVRITVNSAHMWIHACVLCFTGHLFAFLLTWFSDAEILAELDQWRGPLDEVKSQIVGYTNVHLEGERENCRQYECNLGKSNGNTVLVCFLQSSILSLNRRPPWYSGPRFVRIRVFQLILWNCAGFWMKQIETENVSQFLFELFTDIRSHCNCFCYRR